MDFTAKETALLESFIEQLYAERYFSDVSPEDFVGIMGMDIHAVGGVLSSLEKKGVLFVDPDAAPDFHIVYLSDDWHRIHPRWAEDAGVEYTPLPKVEEEPAKKLSPRELAEHLLREAPVLKSKGKEDYIAAAAELLKQEEEIRKLRQEVEKLKTMVAVRDGVMSSINELSAYARDGKR